MADVNNKQKSLEKRVLPEISKAPINSVIYILEEVSHLCVDVFFTVNTNRRPNKTDLVPGIPHPNLPEENRRFSDGALSLSNLRFYTVKSL